MEDKLTPEGGVASREQAWRSRLLDHGSQLATVLSSARRIAVIGITSIASWRAEALERLAKAFNQFETN